MPNNILTGTLTGMLSGNAIVSGIEKGDIVITPFNEKQLNPNSYNITLGDELSYYTDEVLDSKTKNPTVLIKIPEEGYVLEPGILYLAKTNEYTESNKHIPQLSGRSSVGRVGVTVHICAGFGAIGYKGHWTLGLTCLKPTKIYSGMEIGQIYFYTIEGGISLKYDGKYQNKGEIFQNKSYEDFK